MNIGPPFQTNGDVGALQWDAPTTTKRDVLTQWASPITSLNAPTTTTIQNIPTPNGPKQGSIGAIIGAYKMAVTRHFRSVLNKMTLWQRNYYEHIIRNDEENEHIHLYIQSKVSHWETDQDNLEKIK